MEAPKSPPEAEFTIVNPDDKYAEVSRRFRENEALENAHVQRIMLDVFNRLHKALKRKSTSLQDKMLIAREMGKISNAHTVKQKNQLQIGAQDIKTVKKTPVGLKPPKAPPQLESGSGA